MILTQNNDCDLENSNKINENIKSEFIYNNS